MPALSSAGARSGAVRRALRIVRWTLIGALGLVALGVLALRIVVANIDSFRPRVEAAVSAYVGHAVHIGALQATWHGWVLELRMRNVRLLDEQRDEQLLELDNARLYVDPLGSWQAGRIAPGRLIVSGASIALTREADGSLTASGLRREAGAASAQDSSRDRFLEWALGQNALELEQATVVWKDRRSDREPIVLSDVTVRTGYDGVKHTLTGAARLPPLLGEKLAFHLSLSGAPTSRDWSGAVSLKAERIDLNALPGLAEALEASELAGTLDLDLTTSWREAKLTKAQGEYHVSQLALGWPDTAATLKDVKAKLTWTRTETGWNAELERVRLLTEHGAWRESEALITLERDRTGERRELRGQLGFARLEDLWPFLAHFAPEAFGAKLHGLRAAGEVEGLRFSVRENAGGELTEAQLDAALSGVSVGGSGADPLRIAGLSGHVQADLFGGRLAMDPAEVRIEAPGLLPETLALYAEAGFISWVRRGSGWWFDTPGIKFYNPDASGRVSGKLHWPYGNRLPIVDLALTLDTASLPRITRVLPITALKPRLGGWLERSVRAGRLDGAEFRYRGYAGNFPSKGPDEAFTIKAKVVDLDLDYSPRWPSVSGIGAELLVRGKELRFRASSGLVHGARIDDAIGFIPDLREHEPVLAIDATLVGPTAEGAEFLRSGALAERFEPLVRDLETEGDMTIALELRLALPRGERSAKGTVTFDGATLDFTAMKVRLEGVAGNLAFVGGTGVSAEGLEAEYRGRAVVLDVTPQPGEKMTAIRLRGRADRAFLIEQLAALALFADPADPPRVMGHMHGELEWVAELGLPQGWGREDVTATLRIESDLAGLEIDLPYPFTKPAAERSTLRVESTFGGSSRTLVSIRFADDIGGRFELERNDPPAEGFNLVRGAVVFGAPTPPLPAQPGLHVGGQLEDFSIDAWTALLRPGPGAAPAQDEYPIARVLKQVEVRASRLELLGHSFPETHVTGFRKGRQGWAIRVQGDSVDGSIELPEPRSSEPVLIELEKLVLTPSEEEREAEPYDPRTLPPIKFSAKQLHYDDLDLGAVKLSTTPHPEGLNIDPLIVLSKGYEANAAGSWRYVDGSSTTKLGIELHADDLGGLLDSFGFDGSGSSGGATDILVTSEWAGSPGDFSLASVGGVLHFRASRGRLLEVDRGAAGRVVGFMLISALPRRLMLDFNDLFGEGVAYDLIEGSFAIENGHAYTNNLTLESEAALMQLAGRTGLVAKDYDQVITVTPRLASSLPLAPIWLLEKMLNKQVFDKAFSFQYAVSGTWQDPEVERITALETEPRQGSRD